jgi:alpha-glucosidase (family GH31 glycosyl hydrolase)
VNLSNFTQFHPYHPFTPSFRQHSLYGWSETVATQQAIRTATGSRGSVISRSTFPSSGHYGGHWLGDNESKWPDLRLSIIGIQEFEPGGKLSIKCSAFSFRFNMFGIPQVGADVCGFGKDTNEVGIGRKG